MEVNINDTRPNGSTSIRDRLDSWYRSVQYEPWFIKISTIDRRILLTLFVSVFVLLIIIIVAASASGSGPDRQDDIVRDIYGLYYRGSHSKTRSGNECVQWSKLNRSIHTVTIDRFPDHGLGDHNYCRNPDLSRHLWCYTSLDMNHFDYCTITRARRKPNSQEITDEEDDEENELVNLDASCDQNITVIVENGLSVSGLYVLSSLWANGRGVYVREDYKDGKVKGDMCMSWHGRYRHWWIQSCGFIGSNGGIAWLEEDARCPYQGVTWRRGGTDAKLNQTFATNGKCIEYGKEYNGTIAPGVMSDIQQTETPSLCQSFCWKKPGCVGFSWAAKVPCKLFSKITGFTYNHDYVSGLATCKEKEKVGCPKDHLMINPSVCVKFLTRTRTCDEGCSRYTAMEECELSGGFLLDHLEPETLTKLVNQIGSTSYKDSFWWTGATDFSKKGTGKFTWERSDILVENVTDLWVNVSTHAEVGQKKGDSHDCVFLGPVNTTQEIKLDHTDCRDSVARPLCQYLVQ